MEIPIAIGVAVVLLALVAGLIAYINSRPEHFRVARSAEVHAPADAIFALINDFHQWPHWSPYEKLDPNMKKVYEGPPSGVGASYAWAGNNKAGEGRATITEVKPNELVSIKLEFFKPFANVCQANFKLTPSAAGTHVTWSIDGANNFMAKAMSLVMNMDKLIGKDFEEGLANLNKATAKTPATA